MIDDDRGSGSRPSRLRPDKRQAILEAAERVFMRDGFGLAGIDDIVAESGVSKRTLYAHFPSKEALFGAIVRDVCDELLTPLRQPRIDDATPRETLIALGRTFLDVILSPKALSLYRVVVAEAPRFPELGRLFFEAGHSSAAALLADYIERMIDRGAFRPVDSRHAAEAFYAVMCGFIHDRKLLQMDGGSDTAAIEAHLTLITDLFLDGLTQR